jgi:hypothetical protein
MRRAGAEGVRPGNVLRLLTVFVAVLAVACVAVRERAKLRPVTQVEIVASVWRQGQLAARSVLGSAGARDASIDQAMAAPGATLVWEQVTAEGEVLRAPELAFAMSLVPGREGLRARLRGKTAYLTPDDMLSRQLYDHGTSIDTLTLSLGFDVPAAMKVLAERLQASVEEVARDAQLERIRVARSGAIERPAISPSTLSRQQVRDAVVAAARHLARGVSGDGHFRYLIDAPSDRTLPGYDWPRHAGATLLVAQVASLTKDAALADASRRAAGLIRTQALGACGEHRCVADGDRADLGSSAIALMAFAELSRAGLDPSATPLVAELAGFLRAQQRPDGEFMHQYDRNERHPIDVQGLYYSGEATLALARAHRVTGDPRDLAAASRGLHHLVGPAWSFFGNRYYYGEEHWTCEALGELWPVAPDREALDFCLGWQRFNRAVQLREGDAPFDCDGGLGVGPLVTPRLTPTASRCEAAIATLSAARRAGVDARELREVEEQSRRALALLLRQQFLPGPVHLFREPADVLGAIPASEVEWVVRIDYEQHAGAAMLRWLELTDST